MDPTKLQATVDTLEEASSAPPADEVDVALERATHLFIDGRPSPGSWARAAQASLQRAHVGRAISEDRRRAERRVRLIALAIAIAFAAGYWIALGGGGPLGSFAGL